MNITKSWLIFLLVIFIAACLRLYAINQIPVSLYWDEVAIGYNAYSIAETGKDEYGNAFPILFRSFDDYKMPGSIYITALFTKFFGLSELAVRLPSAILGILSVAITYFLVKRITDEFSFENQTFFKQQGETLALLSAGLLAISPWHIQFSRTGFEANFGLFFILLGFLLFFTACKKPPLFILSFFIFACSFYFYRSVIVFLPLILSVVLIMFFKELFIERKKYLFIAGLIFLITLLPILFSLSSSEGMKRFGQVSSSAEVQEKIAQNTQKIQANGNKLIDKIVYNRRLVFFHSYLQNYVSHFSPQFLLFRGDVNGRHHVSGMGQLYLWEGIFLIVGIFGVFFLPYKLRIFLLAWLLFAPIPAAVSFPAPHALRSLYMLPVLQIIIAVGIIYTYLQLRKHYRHVFLFGLSIVMFSGLLRYGYLSFHITPTATASEWGDGYKQIVSYTKQKEDIYDKIIVSGHYWQPYIYFLFYNQVSPADFQKNGSSVSFGKYYFGGTSWDQDKHRVELDKEDLRSLAGNKHALVVLSPEEYVVQKSVLNKIDTVEDTVGKTKYIISELKK